MSPVSVDHVMIVGAGIAGLALAQALLKKGIDFTIYERDPTWNYRPQGYRIKIFPDTIVHLKDTMSLELWKEFENCCAVTVMGESTINALSATLISSRALRGIRPYTVDRSVLRKVLVKGLEDKIQFGKKFSKYTINPDSVTITFEDGTESSGTLLVGADGGRSQIRQIFLPDFKTVDPEGICIFGKTPITDELKKRILPKALQWFVVVRDTAPVIQQVIWGSELPVSMFVEKMSFPNRSLTEMELPEDYLYWSMLLPTKLLGMTEDAVTASINRPSTEIGLDITCEWDPSLKCIIELQDPSQGAAIRIISGPPMLPEWETSDRVALIGDAIHVMAPSGGVGVATALKDASILSDKLAQGGISKSSIGAYESEMRIYAEASIRRSFAGGKLFFGQPPFDQCKEVSFKATSGEE